MGFVASLQVLNAMADQCAHRIVLKTINSSPMQQCYSKPYIHSCNHVVSVDAIWLFSLNSAPNTDGNNTDHAIRWFRLRLKWATPRLSLSLSLVSKASGSELFNCNVAHIHTHMQWRCVEFATISSFDTFNAIAFCIV